MGSFFQPDVAISESARLDSDQVNYLIWRYLQESGYGEAAVKLQRDWKLDPQSLPLAKHIKGGALIRLIKYGLRYYYTDRTWDRQACKKVPLQSSMLFFGPDSARHNVQLDEDAAGESETGTDQPAPTSPNSTNARKHPRESGPTNAADQAPQPLSKKSRKIAVDDHERSVEQQQQQPPPPLLPPLTPNNAETTPNEKISIENDQPQDQANFVSSDSGPPVPEAKSPSASDLDQDTDMDMGLTNGMAQGFEVSNGGPGIGMGNFEPQDQDHDQDHDQDEIMMNNVPAAVPTLDSGHSVGVQSAPAKAAESEELVAESIILHVADEGHVTDASWRPADPTVLAASGHDFVGVWKVPSQPSRPGAVLPPLQRVVDKGDESMVTAMAWEPGGTMLAIAVFDDHTAGAIRIYDGQDAVLIESLPAAQRLITTLRWQKTGSRLMGFATSTDESSLVLWDLSGSAPLPGTFSITVPEHINDISWASHGNAGIVCAAGDGVVYQCRAAPELVIEHKWSSDLHDHSDWTTVKCSLWSEEATIIIAASANPPALWIPAKNVYARDIHSALLTCLDVRPMQIVHPDRDPYCDFATSSVDGAVKMWRYNDRAATIECLFKLSMSDSTPIHGLSYMPDGHAIAAASYERVMLWQAEKRGSPLARWEGHEDSWGGAYLKRRRWISQGETMSEDGAGEDTEHSLTWDAESRKLAFALGNQVAVIHFQR